MTWRTLPFALESVQYNTIAHHAPDFSLYRVLSVKNLNTADSLSSSHHYPRRRQVVSPLRRKSTGLWIYVSGACEVFR